MPRKYDEKTALLKQKVAEQQQEFDRVMREVTAITKKKEDDPQSDVNFFPPSTHFGQCDPTETLDPGVLSSRLTYPGHGQYYGHYEDPSIPFTNRYSEIIVSEPQTVSALKIEACNWRRTFSDSSLHASVTVDSPENSCRQNPEAVNGNDQFFSAPVKQDCFSSDSYSEDFSRGSYTNLVQHQFAGLSMKPPTGTVQEVPYTSVTSNNFSPPYINSEQGFKSEPNHSTREGYSPQVAIPKWVANDPGLLTTGSLPDIAGALAHRNPNSRYSGDHSFDHSLSKTTSRGLKIRRHPYQQISRLVGNGHQDQIYPRSYSYADMGSLTTSTGSQPFMAPPLPNVIHQQQSPYFQNGARDTRQSPYSLSSTAPRQQNSPLGVQQTFAGHVERVQRISPLISPKIPEFPEEEVIQDPQLEIPSEPVSQLLTSFSARDRASPVLLDEYLQQDNTNHGFQSPDQSLRQQIKPPQPQLHQLHEYPAQYQQVEGSGMLYSDATTAAANEQFGFQSWQ